MAFDSQEAICADTTVVIQWQTSRRQPGGSLASRAKQAGSAVVAVVVDHSDICSSQQLLNSWPKLPSAVAARAPASASGVVGPERLPVTAPAPIIRSGLDRLDLRFRGRRARLPLV